MWLRPGSISVWYNSLLSFFLCRHPQPWDLNLTVCDSLQNICSLLVTVLCVWKDVFLPLKRKGACIHSFLWRAASEWVWCRYKTAGGQTSVAEAEVGGREDCVAVSLWLSWDLKLWSGSFRLPVMWQLSFLELADCREAIITTILILICWSIHFNSHSVIPSERADVCVNSSNVNCVVSFLYTITGSDNLARCGALESLVNDMADDTWDNKAVNRISAIHFLDNEEEEDDDKVSKTKGKFHYHPSGSWWNLWWFTSHHTY